MSSALLAGVDLHLLRILLPFFNKTPLGIGFGELLQLLGEVIGLRRRGWFDLECLVLAALLLLPFHFRLLLKHYI